MCAYGKSVWVHAVAAACGTQDIVWGERKKKNYNLKIQLMNNSIGTFAKYTQLATDISASLPTNSLVNSVLRTVKITAVTQATAA